MIDLNKFCDKERAPISKPFSRGAFSYATDGYICIRIPRRKKTRENPDAPDVERVFADAKAQEPYTWVDIPEVKLKQGECYNCRGTGKWVDVDNKEYPCEEYEGTVLVEIPQDISLGLDGTNILFRGVYLDLIKEELPNPKLGLIKAIADRINSHPIPAMIKFDGGMGLIMPIRP